MRFLRWSVLPLFELVIITSGLLRAADEPAKDAVPTENLATKAEPRDANWMKRHEKINARAKEGNVDLLFIGDSITQIWEVSATSSRPSGGGGKDVWKKYYGERKAMNAGISGDQTQHVLWRLDNGNIDGIHPKLAVVLIGTNNTPDSSGKQTGEQIGEGLTAIAKKLREKLPDTKLLLLAVFPRSDKSPEENESMRQKLAKVNFVESKLADGKTIFFLDLNSKFLDAEGKLPKDIFADGLHPNAKGYEIWAAAMEPKIVELLGEKK